METKYNEFRDSLKNSIVEVIAKIYLKHNDNQMPNWDNGEEIVVEDTEIKCTNYIQMIVDHGGDNALENWVIEEYRVCCNGELFFWCTEDLQEVYWIDVSTDDLMNIYRALNSFLAKINI